MDQPVADSVAGRGWSLRRDSGATTIALTDDWIARDTGVAAEAVPRILARAESGPLRFDSTRLGSWDSALIVFLWTLRGAAKREGVGFDPAGLPDAARKLLGLAGTDPGTPPPAPRTASLPERVGQHAFELWSQTIDMLDLVGNTVLRAPRNLAGRGGMRWVDLLDAARESGIGALVIVSIVNFLVGAILAFVGAVQLRRFGAGIYVASLVGIAMAREMAALMTAIVMSGRTGGAYAAHIATMQGNEEIDALRVFGIPVFDYVVLPRIVALTAMMPLLYFYACAIGFLGGLCVALITIDVTWLGFAVQLRASVGFNQFLFGLIKSVVFGGVIAIVGCLVGLRAGRSAADVGRAATAAVVIGIVSVIAIDAVFAVCANALGI